MFIGVEPVHQRHIAVHLLSTRPILIPVKSDPPDILRGFRIVEDRLCPLDDQIPVMIPHDDVDVAEALLYHDRTKVVLEKIPLVLSLKDTRLPPLGGHRLVLDGDPPYRHACLAIALNELRKVERPGMSVLGAQVTAVQHVIVVLHERRRAPGTGEELEPVPARGHRPPDERDPEPQVVRDGEGVQVLVTLIDIRVALAREVAAVDVGPGQRVPDPAVGAVIRSEEHTSELQSPCNLVCRLLLEKKKKY